MNSKEHWAFVIYVIHGMKLTCCVRLRQTVISIKPFVQTQPAEYGYDGSGEEDFSGVRSSGASGMAFNSESDSVEGYFPLPTGSDVFDKKMKIFQNGMLSTLQGLERGNDGGLDARTTRGLCKK